jgi:hypothetical protein
MPDPTFTAAPDDIPSRGNPSTFSVLTDPFLVWQKTNRNEMSDAVPWFADSVTATAADVVTTGEDVVSTNADVVSTGDDAAQTALDRIATGNDVTATGTNLAAFQAGYIGKYADDAAADASGFTIGAGVFYFKDTGVEATSGLRVYNGGWSAAVLDTAGALMAVNDLSDVASGSTALGNIGGAPLASPTFTGTPVAPTATIGTDTTQVATTAFVLANGTALASEAEAEAGTNNTKAMTPLRSAQAIAALAAAPPMFDKSLFGGN